MAWVYSQSTGRLEHVQANLSFKCYSGKGEGRNNPSLEAVACVGPIPRGNWIMCGIRNDGSKGPFRIVLMPSGHNAHERSAFELHGDNATHDASEGCIIHSPRVDREIIYSTDINLTVIE